MCGRFTIAKDYQAVKAFVKTHFNLSLDPSLYPLPRYNIAPSQMLLTIIYDGDKYRIGTIKWGFIPPFSSDYAMAYKMINARSETVDCLPSFMPSLKNKRCLIIADGYYEWDRMKTPHYFKNATHNLFVFAGLYAKNEMLESNPLYTATIITQQAHDNIAAIHERMPLILDEQSMHSYLNPNSEETLIKMVKTPSNMHLNAQPVSKIVNQVRNDFLDCIKTIN